MPERLRAEYLLPLRWSSDEAAADLTSYLRQLAQWLDVTVIDGSEPRLFAAHAQLWGDLVRHVAVGEHRGANGKVRGVLTGLELARHDRVVIADDDVRYSHGALATVVADLAEADLVRPQNYFDPLPWHARWDTARILLNRALSSDFPGTYAVRRSTLMRAGGYDADVLFENLEMERTVRAVGGTVRDRPEVFVARRPPTAAHFRSQRVRQAYDSFAQPHRLALEAAILPIAVCAGSRRPGALVLLLVALSLLAERGRRRSSGRSVFPPSSALWTPLWLAERGVTSWAAIALRVAGGVRYGEARLARAATPLRVLRRRHGQGAGVPGGVR
jgi:hypothetical protein